MAIKSAVRKLTAKNRTTNGAEEDEKGNNVEVDCDLKKVHGGGRKWRADVLTPVHPVDDGLHGALRGVAVQDHAVSLLCL